MVRKYLVIGSLAVLLSVLLVQSAGALIARNTFQPEALLDGNGRHIWVTAQIECTAGEKLTVEVTISQERGEGKNQVGALAKGSTNTVCEGIELENETGFQAVTIRAKTQGSERFEPGPAVASGLAISRDRNQVTGVRQWQPTAGITIQSQ